MIRFCTVDAMPVLNQLDWDDKKTELITELVKYEPVIVLKERPGWLLVQPAHYSNEGDEPGWVPIWSISYGQEPEGSWRPMLSPDLETPILESARTYHDTPYRWGGMTECGIDCSGLVHRSYRDLGFLIPRDSYQQESFGKVVDPSDLLPGDLVTFGKAESPMEGRPNHIAFWLGNDTILHATYRPDMKLVVEEALPDSLRSRIRRYIRIPRKLAP